MRIVLGRAVLTEGCVNHSSLALGWSQATCRQPKPRANQFPLSAKSSVDVLSDSSSYPFKKTTLLGLTIRFYFQWASAGVEGLSICSPWEIPAMMRLNSPQQHYWGLAKHCSNMAVLLCSMGMNNQNSWRHLWHGTGFCPGFCRVWKEEPSEGGPQICK